MKKYFLFIPQLLLPVFLVILLVTAPLVNAWDLSTVSYDNKSIDVSGQETPIAVTFSYDGTKMYTLGQSSDTLYQYSLSTPWDISTGTYDETTSYLWPASAGGASLRFSSDGKKMFIVGREYDRIHQYSLSTAWDISTLVNNNVLFSVASIEANATSLAFNTTGTKMYVAGGSGSIYQFSLPVPWSLTNATYDDKSYAPTEAISPAELSFNADGTKMYVMGGDFGNTIYQYSLSTAFDVSTASYDDESFTPSEFFFANGALAFRPDGTKMYLDGADGSIYQYSLTSTDDTVNPVVTTLLPSDGATNVTSTSNLVIQFDEDVDVGTGNITIKKTSDNTTVETIDITSEQVTGTGTTTITINPSEGFEDSTSYYIQVDATAFDDADGNGFAGIADTTSWNFTTAEAASKIYWTDNGSDKIQRSNLDGSNVEDLITTGLTVPHGIAVDATGGKMYWADSGKLERANLDGSDVEVLLSPGGFRGIALDVTGGKIYWANSNPKKIQRANLDGSNVEDLVTADIPSPFGFALDVDGGKMYWTNYSNGTIQRANVDGSSVEEIVTDLNQPWDIELDVENGKVYWTDDSTGKIQRANLDGSSVEDVLTSQTIPRTFAIDFVDDKIYWSSNNFSVLRRANLDGSSIENLVTGIFIPSDIALQILPSDTTDPSISTLTPSDNATGVATNSNLVLEFSENVDAESGNITIKKTSDNSTVEAVDVTSGQVTGSGTDTITINPSSDLDEQTEFYVQIDATAFDDAAGNSYAGISDTTSWSFTTADETNPTVDTFSPLDNATSVSPTTNLTIEFTESVDAESGHITIKKSSDDTTVETIDVTSGQVTGSGSSTITINPSVTLDEGTEFYVQIDATAFDDAAGNSYAGISDTTSWSFTTLDFTNPSISTLSPNDGSTGVSLTANLVIEFTEAVDAETGSITIKESSHDTTVETIDVTSGQVTGSGTATITINPSVTLDDATSYYINVDATAFDDTAGNSFAGITDATTWNFTTVDQTDPTVFTFSPTDNSTGVSTTTDLVITFDEAVDVETGDILLKRTSDDVTVETIDVTSGQVTGSGTSTITIDRSVILDEETEYYVQIDTTAFDDGAGNSYAGISDATSWSFTTLSGNTLPTITSPSDISQAKDGSGYVTFKTKLTDSDGDLTQVKVEYSTNETEWSDLSLQSAGSSQGEVSLSNEAEYQISSIDTDTGEVTVTITWKSKENIEGREGRVFIRVTPYDGDEEGVPKVSEAFSVDNEAPIISNIRLNDRTNRSLLIGWDIDSGAEPNFEKYELCYSRTRKTGINCSGTGLFIWSPTQDSALDDVSTTSTTITDLAKNRAYFITLKAYDQYGNVSSLFLDKAQTRNFDPITILVGDIVDRTIEVLWNKETRSNFLRYELCYGQSRSRVQGKTCNANNKLGGAISVLIPDVNTTTRVLTGLNANKNYFFKIFSFVEGRALNQSNVLGVSSCNTGFTKVGGACVATASIVTVPSPTPVPTVVPTPIPTLNPTPSPTPAPQFTPEPSIQPSPEPSPEPGVVGGIVEGVIETIIEPILDLVPEVIVEVVTAVTEAVNETIAVVVETVQEVAEELAASAERVAEQLPEISREVVAAVKELPTSPQTAVPKIKKAIEPIAKESAVVAVNATASTAAVATVAASSSSLTTTLPNVVQQIPYAFGRLWQAMLGLAGLRSKKRKWGRVVNSITGEGISSIVVQIVDTQSQKVVSTVTTNTQGAFDTLLPAGTYSFRVESPEYSLTPTAPVVKLLAGERVYDGGAIRIGQEGLVPIVLVLRPHQAPQLSYRMRLRVVWQHAEAFLARISWPLLLLGILINSLIVFAAPTAINIFVEVIYALLVILKIRISLVAIKATGRVTDSTTGRTLDLATVRLVDDATGQVVATKVTSRSGKFLLLPKAGVYTLTVTREGYEHYEESHVVIRPERETVDFNIKLGAAPRQMAVGLGGVVQP